MASYLVTAAEGVKTHITAGTPYVINPVTIERRWLPYTDRVAVGTATKVCVVPNGSTQSQLTRSQRRTEIIVDVFIQKAVDWETLSDGDTVSELAEQINERVHQLSSIALGSDVINRIAVTFEPFVIGEHMSEYRLFTSRITSTWLLAN